MNARPRWRRLCLLMELRRGAGAFEHFLEKLMPDSRLLALLNSDPQVARCTLDIFEHSPYFAEELVRVPELIEEFCQLPISIEHAQADHFDDISGPAPLFPARDVSHPGRQHVPARAGVRNAAADLGSGRHGDRGLLPDGGGTRRRIASARHARLSTAPAADGDRAGTAGHARVRPGFGRRPGVRLAG